MEAAEVAAVVGKVAERLYAEDDDDQHEGITEESVAEVMTWLELEIKLAAGGAAVPPPAALLATGSGGGGKESCGSSVSRPASTVMASVDGWRAGAAPPPAVPWPWPLPEPAAMEEGEGEDGGLDDADDEWVSQLLTDGPDVEEPCGSQ